LCNIPLIEYTLEFLAAGGVKEVIVCTKSHADKIEDYLTYALHDV
jgi:translation initiation factor eIF-2B subunit epsilon